MPPPNLWRGSGYGCRQAGQKQPPSAQSPQSQTARHEIGVLWQSWDWLGCLT
ncbi:hypothetical protein [Moraxella lacunata]|uniref:hypothetical protein n=1 Tax=Moraxella lacunata TaxID=477 RepID=UPI003EE18239